MQRNKYFDIAMVQMHVTKDKTFNIDTAIRMVKLAVQKHSPRIVVLPENFNTLYGKEYMLRNAEYIPNGETCMTLSKLARELNIYLVGGSIPELDTNNKNYIYNTITVWGPNGDLITKYRKIHLNDFEYDDKVIREYDLFKSGNHLVTFDCDGFKIGLGIGFDLSFSEFANLYRNQGVDLMIYTANYLNKIGETYWEQMTRARAIDNQFYVLTVSQTRDYKSDYVYLGHSMLVDPYGRVITRAGEKEGIFYGHLDFDDMDRYRNYNRVYKNRRNDVYDTIYKTV